MRGRTSSRIDTWLLCSSDVLITMKSKKVWCLQLIQSYTAEVCFLHYITHSYQDYHACVYIYFSGITFITKYERPSKMCQGSPLLFWRPRGLRAQANKDSSSPSVFLLFSQQLSNYKWREIWVLSPIFGHPWWRTLPTLWYDSLKCACFWP